MPPPRARTFVLDHLAAFDDEALRAFLVPGKAGVKPRRLGVALQGRANEGLAARVASALPPTSRVALERGLRSQVAPAAIERARRYVVNQLFWPLLYWHDPGSYEELVAAEHIHPELLGSLRLRGRVVADLGAGAGRFTLFAAAHASRVIAVDIVPALLARLEARARALQLTNVETRRGDFLALPLADASVDVAVACSSLTSHPPFGGEAALTEARRIVRPGGEVVVIWPDDPSWFLDRGFSYIALTGNQELHFADVATALRVCGDFYPQAAVRWIRAHRAASVPFAVVGVPPPNDACILRVPAAAPAQR